MKQRTLQIYIPKDPHFFSLYADGKEETLVQTNSASVLYYPPDAIVFLYYTYPTHRRVYCIRNAERQRMNDLPCTSLPVAILFKQFASRVDKTKKAVSYIREHYPEISFSQPDSFYSRLDILLLAKGKLDYSLLDELIKRTLDYGCTCNS